MNRGKSLHERITALDVNRALEEICVFPLAGIVLFPGQLLGLHIFEERYRTMLKDCLARSGVMAIAQVRHGSPDEHGNPPFSSIAGVGIIKEHEPLSDGRSNILLWGMCRAKLTELPFEPPYRRATAEAIEDKFVDIDEADRTALLDCAMASAREVKRRDPSFTLAVSAEMAPGYLADRCAEQLLAEPSARQRVLEEVDPVKRARLVLRELVRERPIAPLGGPLN